jgi:2-dehydro-3-deoxy-D-arabinonate dehydratase
MRRTVGHEGTIHVRSDSSWTVPEPELGVVLDGNGRPAAMTIGNDVSSRDIEGENPLYIPQAKVFAGACAIGPVLAVPESWDAPLSIQLRIFGSDGRGLFAGETSTARMKRTVHDLVSWLVRDNPVPPGSVLLTGTGLVPPDDYTLEPGHVVEIEIEGIGVLTNVVA